MPEFDAEYAVRCPRCRAQAVASMVRTGTKGTYREAFAKLGAARITCLHCGFCREGGVHHHDDYEFWFVTEFRGRRLWARNRRHLDFLIKWLESGVTDRGPDGASQEALPKWLRAAKNRPALLELLRRMQREF